MDGNRATGTADYRAYGRDHIVQMVGKPDILGSADPSFRGDAARQNPEELLVAALAQCHMLWYLHLCTDAGVVLVSYRDRAVGQMHERADGPGAFTEVVLHPKVTITSRSDHSLAVELHARAHAMCFIANSVRFPIRHRPVVMVVGSPNDLDPPGNTRDTLS